MSEDISRKVLEAGYRPMYAIGFHPDYIKGGNAKCDYCNGKNPNFDCICLVKCAFWCPVAELPQATQAELAALKFLD